MMKLNFLVCVSLLSGLLFYACRGVSEKHSFPNYPVSDGVSAPFAGFIGDYMLVGGGCNFPDIPAADGGKKKFYKEAYLIPVDTQDKAWKQVKDLPLPLAYGASAEVHDGLICIGGMNADSVTTQVFRIRLDKTTNDVVYENLPSLPEAIDNAAAVCLDGKVYVVGGNSETGNNSFYVFHPQSGSWLKLKDYSGYQRVQPVLLASGKTLYLAGGFAFDKEKKQCHLSPDMIPYNIESGEWGDAIPFPEKEDGRHYAISGASGVSAGGKLYMTGGVDFDIFKGAMEGKAPADYMKKPSEWYRFNKDVLVYDVSKEEWKVYADVEGMNKAGGVLLRKREKMYMVCGEIKPGVRTSEIKVMNLGKE